MSDIEENQSQGEQIQKSHVRFRISRSSSVKKQGDSLGKLSEVLSGGHLARSDYFYPDRIQTEKKRKKIVILPNTFNQIQTNRSEAKSGSNDHLKSLRSRDLSPKSFNKNRSNPNLQKNVSNPLSDIDSYRIQNLHSPVAGFYQSKNYMRPIRQAHKTNLHESSPNVFPAANTSLDLKRNSTKRLSRYKSPQQYNYQDQQNSNASKKQMDVINQIKKQEDDKIKVYTDRINRILKGQNPDTRERDTQIVNSSNLILKVRTNPRGLDSSQNKNNLSPLQSNLSNKRTGREQIFKTYKEEPLLDEQSIQFLNKLNMSNLERKIQRENLKDKILIAKQQKLLENKKEMKKLQLEIIDNFAKIQKIKQESRDSKDSNLPTQKDDVKKHDDSQVKLKVSQEKHFVQKYFPEKTL